MHERLHFQVILQLLCRGYLVNSNVVIRPFVCNLRSCPLKVLVFEGSPRIKEADKASVDTKIAVLQEKGGIRVHSRAVHLASTTRKPLDDVGVARLSDLRVIEV